MAKLNNIIQQVKAHPGIAETDIGKMADGDLAFAISQVIFVCLDELSLRVGADAFSKHYALTDPADVTVALAADGTADLTLLITDDGLLLESLHQGEIRHPSSAFPLVRQAHSGEGALPGNYDKIYLHYWLVGLTLHTRSSNNNTTPLTGSLSFACPRRDALNTLHPNLDRMLVDMLVARLRGAPLKEAAPQ